MAKVGTMPVGKSGAVLPGLPHFAKPAAAPKQRQNMLNIRLAPLKRMTAQIKPVKPDKPDDIDF